MLDAEGDYIADLCVKRTTLSPRNFHCHRMDDHSIPRSTETLLNSYAHTQNRQSKLLLENTAL